MFCLIPKFANEFIAKLKSGEIDPAKLAEMSSADRRAAFGKIMGEENAKQVNTLFESKLLLKNQQAGMINWAKQVAGMKPEIQKDIISRVNKMDKVLNAENQQAFLEDLAAHKLGATVTMGEAAKISELAKQTADLKGKVDPNSPAGSDSRMVYGRAQVDFINYISDLKNETKKLTLQDFKNAPGKATAQSVSNLAGLAKSLKATLDNSVLLRQGLKVLFTHPKIWLKNSFNSFKDIVRVFGGKEVMNEVRAEVNSRPNALNGQYKKEGLAVGVTEEAFPTNLPGEIPVFGRIFKASETAFTAFQYRTRADIFDKYYEIAQKSGADISGIGKVANSLTGRGTFGQRGEAAATAVNNIFFSPRLVKSHIDLLTAHAFDSNISPFARKQAAINLIKVVSGIAGVMVVANAVNPGSAETDARSADFGKIRVKDTRFDYTGGMASLATLATRLTRMSSKSSTTGKVTPLNAKSKTGAPLFGAQTGTDMVYNFLENKLSPAASVVKDILQGSDFSGNKPTVLNEASNLLTPLPITTYIELKNNPNSADVILSMIADALGISTNTYSAKKK